MTNQYFTFAFLMVVGVKRKDNVTHSDNSGLLETGVVRDEVGDLLSVTLTAQQE